MKFWKRMPIGVQFFMLLLISAVISVVCAYQIGAAMYLAETRNQARTVADMVDNVGTWASQYNGIWVKSDPTSDTMKVGNYLERDLAISTPASRASAAAYHRKNPALVQRELADVTLASGSKATYRMTSDKFMNPKNAPTRFELSAIERLRESKEREYSEVKEGNLLFARKLVASAACLKCHSTPERAPAAVRAMYGTTNGFGYQEGELAGIISVVIPLAYAPFTLVKDFTWATWTALVAFLLSPLMILLYIQQSVVSPVRKIKVFAEKAAHSELGHDIGQIQFDEDEYSSDNEVHRLSAAIKALYQSIRLLRQEKIGHHTNVTLL